MSRVRRDPAQRRMVVRVRLQSANADARGRDRASSRAPSEDATSDRGRCARRRPVLRHTVALYVRPHGRIRLPVAPPQWRAGRVHRAGSAARAGRRESSARSGTQLRTASARAVSDSPLASRRRSRSRRSSLVGSTSSRLEVSLETSGDSGLLSRRPARGPECALIADTYGNHAVVRRAPTSSFPRRETSSPPTRATRRTRQTATILSSTPHVVPDFAPLVRGP